MSQPFLIENFRIRWSTLTAEHIVPDITNGLEIAEANLQTIRDLSEEEVTYENTFIALEEATKELSHAWGCVNHLNNVSNNDEQREALNEMLPKVSAFYSSISLDSDIWAALKAFEASSEASQLNEVQKRFIKETCKDFIQAGADLPEEQKARMAEIDLKLSEVTQKYSENVLDTTNAWELVITNKDDLKGLPGMFIDMAQQDALSKELGSAEEPQYRFTLQQPSFYPVLQYVESDAIRKKIWEGLNTIGNTDDKSNSDLVWEICSLRHEKAQIMDKQHFADLVLEDRMAQSGKGALTFTEDLHKKVKPFFLADHEELLAFMNEQSDDGSGESIIEIMPWQGAYWAEKLRIAKYDFDSQELRPYFEIKQVMQGMFNLCSSLFNIRIEEQASHYTKDATTNDVLNEDSVEVWDTDCTYYHIYDSNNEEFLGGFYADWHPRESKRGGAWMGYLKTGLPSMNGNDRVPHLGYVIGNMTKPVPGKPTLMEHNEVETIFHEFGHLLHHMLGDSEVKSLAGTNVPWDFVELPSQIMENFCWNRESLNFFAKHHETGEPIPDALFDKMIAAKNFRTGSFMMRQLSLGKIDLELHTEYQKYEGKNLDQLDDEILADYKVDCSVKSPTLLRKFGHLFSDAIGYAAGYYSYNWAAVLDADAFTRFEKEGVLNPEVGLAFRNEVLSRGNTRPVDESYRAFMGRDADLEPLLIRSGLVH